MMKNFFFLSFCIGLISCTSSAVRAPSAQGGQERPITRPIVLPEQTEELSQRCTKSAEGLSTDFPIHHRAYDVSYNFYHRVPNWIFHRLNRENLMNSCGKRNDKFKADPVLVSLAKPAVKETDYKGTGFDRGHMAPSADFLWNQDVNSESFFMTNMAPQTAGLNQRTWNKLEERVRLWACGHGELRVYTGPLLKSGLKKLNSCVSVPEEFFKVILSYRDGKYKGIAFIYNQDDNAGDPYREKAVSIREVEKRTGIDFFKDEFAVTVQNSFEEKFDWADWDGTEQSCMQCPQAQENAPVAPAGDEAN